MDKMKAYVFKDVGQLVFEEKPIPYVKDPDDVLLMVKWNLGNLGEFTLPILTKFKPVKEL